MVFFSAAFAFVLGGVTAAESSPLDFSTYAQSQGMMYEFSEYENQDLKFKIKYPMEFDVAETFNDTSFTIGDPYTHEILVGISDKIKFSSDSTKFFTSPDVPFFFGIRIHEATETMEETREVLSDEKGNLFFWELVRLGGQEAFAATIQNQSDFHDGYVIGTVYEGKQYSIFFDYPKEQTELYQPTIQYIIDSFEFQSKEEILLYDLDNNDNDFQPNPSDFRETGDNTGLVYAYSGLILVGAVAGFFVVKKLRSRK